MKFYNIDFDLPWWTPLLMVGTALIVSFVVLMLIDLADRIGALPPPKKKR